MPTTAARITNRMPTQREFDKIDAPEIKSDHHAPYRLPFLDRVRPCWPCVTIRSVLLYALALYGLYSLIT